MGIVIDGVRRPARGFWRGLDVSAGIFVRTVVSILVLCVLGVIGIATLFVLVVVFG